jgi:hypothetical protein
LLASNGPITVSDSASAPQFAPVDVIRDQPQIDTVTIDDKTYAHYQVSRDGVIYDAYMNDTLHPGQVMLVPASAPVATPPAAPPAPPAQPTSSAPGASPAQSPRSDSWGIGDLLATMAGLFGPASVGPHVHPQTPANLTGGLQQMAQINAQMAQQSLHDASTRTRAGIFAAGAPYVVAETALAAPAIGSLGYEGSLMAASRFPTAVEAATSLGNALTGTTVPRLAMGVGAAAAAKGAADELPALGPALQNSLPAAETEASALFQARDEAAETARKIVQQELDEGWRILNPQARFGTWLDVLAKTNVRQAVAEGRLPDTFVTSPTVSISRGYLASRTAPSLNWIRAPDVWDTATGRAWDFMAASEAAFVQHEASYLGTTAFGRLDPGGTTIEEIFPLFHLGF